MLTGKNSKPLSPKSKLSSRKAETTELGRNLVRGLKQAIAHVKGEAQLTSYEYRIPEHVNVRAVRKKIGLSQAEFASRYALNRRTLQEWEQGRTEPDLSTRAYLTVIDRNHEAVEDALAARDR